MPGRRDTLARRLFTKVRIQSDGCWVYTGRRLRGHGMIGMGSRAAGKRYVHVVVWEMFNGAVPRGKELHHLCEVRPCCNPNHLMAVTRREHTIDLTSSSLGAINVSKTHCLRGHPLVESNLRICDLKKGHRSCLTCYKIHKRNHWKKHGRRILAERSSKHPTRRHGR
jgi:hypothetical protein